MNQALALRSPEPVFYPRADPRLRLLIELEPWHRVFLRNLADLIFPRKEAPLFLASRPAVLPEDYFVLTGARGVAVVQSIAWHLAVFLLLLASSPWLAKWERQQFPVQGRANVEKAQIAYFPRGESFAALAGSQGREVKAAHALKAHARVVRLKREQRQSGLSAPAIRVAGTASSHIKSLKTQGPAMPLLAASAPPVINQFSGREFSSIKASVVAPPPQAGSAGRAHGITAPVTVIAPAPTLQGSIRASGAGNIDIGASAIIAPAPRLAVQEQRASRGLSANGTLSGSGPAIIPPPPSINDASTASGNGIGNSTIGTAIVPPPPVLGHGSVGGSGSRASLAGAGGQIVGPPPSIGSGSVAAVGGASPVGGGVQVIGPPPAIVGSDGVGRGPGGSAIAGLDVQALPAPGIGNGQGGSGVGGANGKSETSTGDSSGSGQGGDLRAANGESAGGLGNGAATSKNATNLGAAGAGTGDSAGNTSATPIQQATALQPMTRSALPSAAVIVDDPGGTTRELPLHVVQLTLALPRTSYFTNYEAYLAERSVNENQTQLIKLVYIFLPYQSSLMEYGLSNSKKFKLRVTRDPSCDESLMDMTWPEADQPHGASEPRKPESEKNKLPCYRTTAEDYRKALERAR